MGHRVQLVPEGLRGQKVREKRDEDVLAAPGYSFVVLSIS